MQSGLARVSSPRDKQRVSQVVRVVSDRDESQDQDGHQQDRHEGQDDEDPVDDQERFDDSFFHRSLLLKLGE